MATMTFHTGARVSHHYGPAPCTCEQGEDHDSCQIIADLISNGDSPFVPADTASLLAMSSKTLNKMRDRYLGSVSARGSKEGDISRHIAASRREAEDFLPPSSLVANAIRQGRDPAPIRARLAETARRAASAMAAATRRPLGGSPLNAQERKQAEDFAPQSTLAAYRARRQRSTS